MLEVVGDKGVPRVEIPVAVPFIVKNIDILEYFKEYLQFSSFLNPLIVQNLTKGLHPISFVIFQVLLK